jgi:hypothetical protein
VVGTTAFGAIPTVAAGAAAGRSCLEADLPLAEMNMVQNRRSEPRWHTGGSHLGVAIEIINVFPLNIHERQRRSIRGRCTALSTGPWATK